MEQIERRARAPREPGASGHSHTLEASEEYAKRLGLVVVKPAPNELFLDIDDDGPARLFAEKAIERYGARLGIVASRWRRSKSGVGWHVVVRLDRPVPADGRIALQAMLGSDRHHELLSWIAMKKGHESPTLFFELPETLSVAVNTDDYESSVGFSAIQQADHHEW